MEAAAAGSTTNHAIGDFGCCLTHLLSRSGVVYLLYSRCSLCESSKENPCCCCCVVAWAEGKKRAKERILSNPVGKDQVTTLGSAAPQLGSFSAKVSDNPSLPLRARSFGPKFGNVSGIFSTCRPHTHH